MFRANYPEQSNTADFSTTITIRDKTTGTVYDLTDVDVRIELRGQSGCCGLITASLGDGVVTVEDPTSGEISINIPASSMSNLPAGTYSLGVMLKDGDAYIQPIIANVPVAQGLPKWA